MFSFKPRPPRTIGEVIAQRKRFVFTCMACKTITSKEPNELFYKPNMELSALERMSACSECGATNADDMPRQLLLTIED